MRRRHALATSVDMMHVRFYVQDIRVCRPAATYRWIKFRSRAWRRIYDFCMSLPPRGHIELHRIIIFDFSLSASMKPIQLIRSWALYNTPTAAWTSKEWCIGCYVYIVFCIIMHAYTDDESIDIRDTKCFGIRLLSKHLFDVYSIFYYYSYLVFLVYSYYHRRRSSLIVIFQPTLTSRHLDPYTSR